MELENLEICFDVAKSSGAKYIGVKVWMYGFDKYEIIINPAENLDKKLEYYKASYANDLSLKNAPDKIKILGFTFGDSFSEIEEDLMA